MNPDLDPTLNRNSTAGKPLDSCSVDKQCNEGPEMLRYNILKRGAEVRAHHPTTNTGINRLYPRILKILMTSTRELAPCSTIGPLESH